MPYKKIIFGGSVGIILQLLGYSFLDWQFYAAAVAIFVLAEWATERNDLTVESAS
jgi:hypothetical protein